MNFSQILSSLITFGKTGIGSVYCGMRHRMGKVMRYCANIPAVPDDETAETMVGFLIDADIRNFGNFVRMVEIYRPNPEPQENIYFEIGEEFPIITDSNGYRCHGGNPDNGTDQTFDADGNLLTPATGTFDFGDVYFKPRYSPSFGYIPVEDENYCDYYISNSIDLGRPGSKTKSEQKILNSIIHSENFIENTEYNCLNVFLPESSRFDASDIYGKITGVEEVGGTLKVVQEHKEISVVVGQVTQRMPMPVIISIPAMVCWRLQKVYRSQRHKVPQQSGAE